MSKRVCNKHTLSCIIFIYYGFFLCSLILSLNPKPKTVHTLYKMNGISAMLCSCALNPLILEFRDSAVALVDLFKK